MKKRRRWIYFWVLFMQIAAFASCASMTTHQDPVGYVDDSVITARVKSRLAEDDFLKSVEISVKTEEGAVQLGGSVNSQQTVYKADQIVRSVSGVKSVENNLIMR